MSSAALPLDQIKVVEFAGLGPVPFAGMVLAGLGANVIRIDRPGSPVTADPMIGAVGRGKRSIALDLKNPEAIDIVLRLVAEADAVLEGFRPGVMERLGLGPDECRGVNPDLVYGRMTGWGRDGPYAAMAGHDINYTALSGALHAIGSGDHIALPLNLVADNGGGAMFLVAGVLAALVGRERSGGTVVDAAMVDGAALLASPFYEMLAIGLWEDRREANLLDGAAPFYTTYETADGGWMAVGALEPPFYASLVVGLGLDERDLPDQYDRNRWPELRGRFAEAFATRSRAEWEAEFDGTDACVTPVLSLREAPEHPHNESRRVFGGPTGHRLPNAAPRLGSVPQTDLGAATDPGEHTDEILTMLGYETEEIARLRASGAVR
ncbi:MAG: CaiB/BaiF CoA-transferase family protein [Actinomycetota bacterium]